MKRRLFLSILAAAAMIASAASCCNNGGKSTEGCCGGSEGCCATTFSKKLPVGIQLYSVRTDLEKDFYGTLKKIAEMGYMGVEFYGEYYGNSVLQVKKWCTELGLIPFSNHIPFQAMIDDIDKVIEENTILGCQYLVFPYMDEASRPGVDPEQFKKTVAKIGECGAKVAEAGFQMLYHNHDFEFVPFNDGLGYDYIFSVNDRKNLQNEIDVCWVEYSGQSAAEYLTRYAGGIPVVHLKDYKLEGKLSKAPYALIGITTDNSMKDENGNWFEYRPLGEGQIDMPSVIKAAIDGGARWLCVEQDEPSQGRSRLEGVAKSVEYLRSLDLM